MGLEPISVTEQLQEFYLSRKQSLSTALSSCWCQNFSGFSFSTALSSSWCQNFTGWSLSTALSSSCCQNFSELSHPHLQLIRDIPSAIFQCQPLPLVCHCLPLPFAVTETVTFSLSLLQNFYRFSHTHLQFVITTFNFNSSSPYLTHLSLRLAIPQTSVYHCHPHLLLITAPLTFSLSLPPHLQLVTAALTFS